MTDDIQELLTRLNEIEEQLSMAVLEVPRDSLVGSRLRQIKLLTEYVRMGLRKVQLREHLAAKGPGTVSGKGAEGE